MGRILLKETIDKISSTSIDALPDIWDEALASPDAGVQAALRQEWSERASGSASALVQQLGVLIDEGVGWAPWQRTSVVALAGLPTDELLSGREIAERLANVALNLAISNWQKFRSYIEKAVMDMLDPILGAITSIPIVGQVIDLVLGFVFAIVDLIRMHSKKADEDADNITESKRILPATPSPGGDKALVEQFVKNYANHVGDWSPIFMPFKDFKDGPAYVKYESWWSEQIGGWLCPPIKKEITNPFAGGVRIIPAGNSSWGVAANQYNSGFGLGFIPGTGNIHREIQVSVGGKQIVDTGEWLTMTRNGALFLWSLAGNNGPSSLTVDTELVAESWSRYIYAFLKSIDEKTMCRRAALFDGVKPATRDLIRRSFCRTMGLPATVKLNASIEAFPGHKDLRLLRSYQDAILKTTAVAYVNPTKAPPGLRSRIESARKSLLESPLVCRIEIGLIPDQTYKSAVEGKVLLGGIKCSLQAEVKGPERYDVRAPKLSSLPSRAVPGVPKAGKDGTDALLGKPERAPFKTAKKSDPSFMDQYGTHVAAGAAALTAVGGFAWYKNRKKR